MVSSRAAIAIVTWTATAIGAVGAGLAALSALGAGITDQTVMPMSMAQVQAALAEPFSATPRASRTPRPVATPHAPRTPRVRPAPRPALGVQPAAAVTRSLNSPGGNVIARCERNLAYLVSWTPMQGYRADDARRGPAAGVSVHFESSDRKIEIIISCRGGRPVATVGTEGRRHHEDEGWEHG